MLDIDCLGGKSLYEVVKYSTKFTYLPYRTPDRFFNGNTFATYGKRIAQGRYEYRSHKEVWAALDYTYKFGLIVTGRFDQKGITRGELLDQLNSGKGDNLKTLYLFMDNHDGIFFHSEDGRYYHLLHGDGSYWLWEIDEPDIAGHNAQYIWSKVHSVVRLPRIGQS